MSHRGDYYNCPFSKLELSSTYYQYSDKNKGISDEKRRELRLKRKSKRKIKYNKRG